MTNQSQERLNRTVDSYIVIYKELEKMYLNKKYTKEQKKLIKRQMLSIYSGLLNSKLDKDEKKDTLKDLKTINMLDKAYLIMQRQVASHLIKK
ncbi:hypothetical protein [Carnobacterium jeotgali]|nr:hypothetical protein [Carnobacterium jeotgali]